MLFQIIETFNAFGLAYDKSAISTPSCKTKEVVVQPLLIGTFTVKITMHTSGVGCDRT